jgi:hypothetical protein
MIMDAALIDSLCNNLLKIAKAFEQFMSEKPMRELSVQLIVNSSYLQVPLKDSKNSLYA